MFAVIVNVRSPRRLAHALYDCSVALIFWSGECKPVELEFLTAHWLHLARR